MNCLSIVKLYQTVSKYSPLQIKAVKSVHTKPKMEKNGNKKVKKCSICEKDISQARNLERHIQAVHEKNKSHKCSICGYLFFS